MIKKIICWSLIFSLTLFLGGCKNVNGSLDEILSTIYKDLDVSLKSRLISIPLTKDNVKTYLGTSDITFKEGLVSEHMTSAIPYSVILIRTSKMSQVKNLKTLIKENIMNKEENFDFQTDDIIIKSKGNLIIVIMISDKETRELVDKGFANL